MKDKIRILILLFSIYFVACNQIKSKTEQVISKAENKVKNKTNDLLDAAFPHFDAYQADTKANKQRFVDFLQIKITPDIQAIYCHADAIGIDADYQFAFHCTAATAQKIIEKHHLRLDTAATDYAFGLQTDFEWWDKVKIKSLDLYRSQNSDTYFQYFWYDKAASKAYYFDFDL
jgi:hypothetical protein